MLSIVTQEGKNTSGVISVTFRRERVEEWDGGGEREHRLLPVIREGSGLCGACCIYNLRASFFLKKRSLALL